MRQMYVYVMANRSRTLYVGVTNDIARRVWQHKHMQTDGFTRRYLIDRLVYYELAPDPAAAIQREKQIKAWLRAKKVALIESINPRWRDLSLDFLDIRPMVSANADKRQNRGRRDSSLAVTERGANADVIHMANPLDRRGAQNDDGDGS